MAPRVLQEEKAEIAEEKEYRRRRASPASSFAESRSRRRKVTPRWSAFLVSPVTHWEECSRITVAQSLRKRDACGANSLKAFLGPRTAEASACGTRNAT